jgi:type IV secretory pathway VirB10-like protein
MKERLSVAGGVRTVLIVLAAFVSLATAAAGQSTRQLPSAPAKVDIPRLQDSLYDVGADIGRLRSQDAERAEAFQARLDDLRDEVIHLKVKQQKDGVSASEYTALRGRIDELRDEVRLAVPASENRASRSGSSGAQDRGTDRPGSTDTVSTTSWSDRDEVNRPVRQGTSGRADEVPAGTDIDVRLENAVSSESAQVEDRFAATTVADLYNGNRLLIPSGSTVRGVVTSVNKAGRVDRKGKLTLAFDRVTVNGRSYPMRGTVEQALESGGYRDDAGKIGAGAGVGAIIGGILGGMKGALAGVLIGGGGVVAATEGQDVTLPAGTVLRIRLESAVTMR